jgi:dUTP pyrophosphatase
VHLELPHGYEAQLRPRSGLAFKHGITILNTPATIDSDYRGELKALLINHGTEDFVINDGDRICQLVIAKHENVEWELVDSVEENTERGKSGFGHTGT